VTALIGWLSFIPDPLAFHSVALAVMPGTRHSVRRTISCLRVSFSYSLVSLQSARPNMRMQLLNRPSQSLGSPLSCRLLPTLERYR